MILFSDSGIGDLSLPTPPPPCSAGLVTNWGGGLSVNFPSVPPWEARSSNIRTLGVCQQPLVHTRFLTLPSSIALQDRPMKWYCSRKRLYWTVIKLYFNCHMMALIDPSDEDGCLDYAESSKTLLELEDDEMVQLWCRKIWCLNLLVGVQMFLLICL